MRAKRRDRLAVLGGGVRLCRARAIAGQWRRAASLGRRTTTGTPFSTTSPRNKPSSATVGRSRSSVSGHLSALRHLFVQALESCQAAGMVRLGRVALDATKVRANASRRKEMSYARMTDWQKMLAAEVSALLAEAGRIDTDEDAQYGVHNSRRS